MKITLNKKEYDVPELDYNAVCEIENYGASLFSMRDKPMLVIRAFLGYVTGLPPQLVGKEIEEHIINGGNLDDAYESLTKAVENSDFLQKTLGK